MKLVAIISSALRQLEHPCEVRPDNELLRRLTRYANEAQMDIARVIGFTVIESVIPPLGVFDLEMLSHQCRKVVDVIQMGHSVKFVVCQKDGMLALPYESVAEITYRGYPKPIEEMDDVSELPEYTHGIIVTYVVGKERDRNLNSESMGNIYLAMYEAALNCLRQKNATCHIHVSGLLKEDADDTD